MASLIERNNRYYVVYTYENEAGEKKQKWEPTGQKQMHSEGSQRLNIGRSLAA